MPGTRRKTSEEPPGDVAPDEMLSTSPFTGDLAEELAAAEPRPRRRLPSVTLLLGAGVLLAAGFAGGIQADKRWGSTSSSNNAAALLNQFAAGRRAFGGGAGGGAFGGGTGGGFGGQFGQGGSAAQAGANATTGTVKLVDGDILYVQTANGIVRVKTNGDTKVGVRKSAKLKNLKAGAPVTVQGTAGQDGTVTATSVTQGR